MLKLEQNSVHFFNFRVVNSANVILLVVFEKIVINKNHSFVYNNINFIIKSYVKYFEIVQNHRVFIWRLCVDSVLPIPFIPSPERGE